MHLKTLLPLAPLLALSLITPAQAEDPGLWKVYNDTFKSAKYVDLTHTMAAPVQLK